MMDKLDLGKEIEGKLKHLFASLLDAGQEAFKPLQKNLLLVVNHVVAQNEEAMQHLKQHAGKSVSIESPLGSWGLDITRAGLFEEGAVRGKQKKADLNVKIMKDVPVSQVFSRLAEGKRPAADIEGDTDLAKTFVWLGENLRWDYKEDLSQIMGGDPAHLLTEQVGCAVQLFQEVLDAIKEWLASVGQGK